ncbi:MAG: TolC family protein [Candidatus Omnitrophica bacterium]|nr:TolC family protein [Candidatus Omnitrophota bacterium]
MKHYFKLLIFVFFIGTLLTVFRGGVTEGDSNAPANSEHIMAIDQGIERLFGGQKIKEFSMEECTRLAIINSFEVKIAKLDLYIAETDLMLSEAVYDTLLYGGASYTQDRNQQISVFAAKDEQVNDYYGGISKKLPTGTELNLEAGDTRLWDEFPRNSFVVNNPSHTVEVKMEVKQPLGKNIFGYVDRGKVTLTSLAVKNASLQSQDDIEALVARAEEAYLELAFAKKNLKIFYDMLDRARKLYDSDNRNFNTGLVERVDLYNSEANVAKREAEVLVAENDYNRSEADLKFIMNIPSDVRVVPSDDLELAPSQINLVDCIKEAFERRRDYYIRKRDVEIRGLDLKIKGNEKWPEIDVTASLTMNGIDSKFNKAVGRGVTTQHPEYYLGVEASFPLENREARSRYDRSKHEKEKSIVNLKKTERAIITEVGNSFNDVMAYEASIVYMTEAVDLQHKKLNEEEKRFKYGRSSTKRIIDYQQDFLFAQLEDARYMLNHRRANVELLRSMNTLLEKYEGLI